MSPARWPLSGTHGVPSRPLGRTRKFERTAALEGCRLRRQRQSSKNLQAEQAPKKSPIRESREFVRGTRRQDAFHSDKKRGGLAVALDYQLSLSNGSAPNLIHNDLDPNLQYLVLNAGSRWTIAASTSSLAETNEQLEANYSCAYSNCF